MSHALNLSNVGEFSDLVPNATALHRRLALWNQRRLAVRPPDEDWRSEMAKDGCMVRLETAFVESFREHVAAIVATAPTNSGAFVNWFEQLSESGPGQWDPLFAWLETEASLHEMKWFLTQEAAGEAGFDDLVAMTQVKLPVRAKLELARNYWDEMGRGSLGGMHGPLLDRTVKGLNLKPSIQTTLWPSLALANTMTAFATQRRYAYHSVGALGVVELTAPGRVAAIAAGLKRLGVAPEQRKYFNLHAHLDVEHSDAWIAEAIAPLIAESPECARFIAEGAVMRLLCGEQCFEVYRAHLWAGAEEAELETAA